MRALVTELAKTPEERDILSLMFAQQVLAYPLLTPPDVPLDRVEALRKRLRCDHDGCRLSGRCQKAGPQGRSGQRRRRSTHLLDKLYATPAAVIDRFAALSGEK